MSATLVPRPALTGSFLVGLCLLVVAAAHADPRAPFVGSWDLVSVENRASDGSVTRPFGAAPRGRITYTPEGFLSAHVMRAARPAFAGEASLYGGSAAEKAAAYDGYIAYYGRYAVDAAAGTVMHRIEGSLFPNWSGSAQTRHYAFAGDTLTLSSPPFEAGGKTIAVHVVWRRAPAE
ncbi:MAG: lipocalin-like domain-containing protein [Gammaproteobacteria bacterium]